MSTNDAYLIKWATPNPTALRDVLCEQPRPVDFAEGWDCIAYRGGASSEAFEQRLRSEAEVLRWAAIPAEDFHGRRGSVMTGGGGTRALTGYAAIAYAEQHDCLLCKHADPTEDDRDDLTPEQARAVVHEDPSLIYLYVPA